MSGRTLRYMLIGGLVLAIGVPSVAVGFGEGRALIVGKRNPSGHRTITRETQIIGNTSTYATRQSNKKIGDGGGAIYGCRSNVGNEPCILTRNLRAGRAFQFETAGKEGGRIEVGDKTGAPFTTNATGVASGLNADQVDGRDSSDLASPSDSLFAAVNADGTLAAGGPEATGSVRSDAAAQTYTVTFGRDVSKCSYTANVTGGSADFSLGVEAGPALNQVRVDQRNADAPEGNPGRAFHLQVVC
jgi:hypothetical protein